MREQADELLQLMLGAEAKFRPGQWDAIRLLAEERVRLLVVQQTGWGKSLVYFIATRLLRDSGAGPTLLISPLLSLMRNQIEMARRIGIRAFSINSANGDAWSEVESALLADACDVLLVSPERLANHAFVRDTLPAIERGIGLFVVDEAHCISDWGHDFRPDYRRILRIVRSLPPSVPVLATTATANDRVVADITAQLGPGLHVLRGPLGRASLRIQVIRLDSQAERLAWLAANLPALPGVGIVYCLTVADCERVSEWLGHHGIDAPAYFGGLESGRREALERRLLRNDVKALVATVALGMGFDKPDLGFVVHFQRPGSVVSYYQQIGRAGRALDEAPAILLNGVEDDEIQEYFIASAFPGAPAMEAILRTLEQSGGGTLRGIQAGVNLSQTRIEQSLKLLEVDGAVERERSTYFRTVNSWAPDYTRWERVTGLRREELRRMQAFVRSDRCLMEFVARELDDPSAAPCGRCAVCAGAATPTNVPPELIERAVTFLKRDARHIEPRRQWPSGWAGPTGRLAAELRNAGGFALSIFGDAGWGRAVADGKYRDERFGDDLGRAAVELIRERWKPDPPPTWVTAVPSLRRPHLVSVFARRLALTLGLPYLPVLEKVQETPEQKTMQNSAQQAANVWAAFRVAPSDVSAGPVLLVDDIVDSGWTFAVCGFLLREAGSGVVHPFALATAAGARRPP